MPKSAGPIKRGNTYYFQRRFPVDLVEQVGKTHIRSSLDTGDWRIAVNRFNKKWNEWSAEFERLRNTSKIDIKRPTDLSGFCAQHSRSVIVREHEYRTNLFEKANANHRGLWSGSIVDLPTDDRYYDKMVEECTVEDITPVLGYLPQLRIRLRIDELKKKLAVGDLVEFKRLAKTQVLLADDDELREIAIQLMMAEIDSLKSLMDNSYRTQLVQERSEKKREPKKTQLLSVVLESYLIDAKRARGMHAKTDKEVRANVRDFIEFSGDLEIEEYQKSDVREFIEALYGLPSSARKKKEFLGMTLPQIVEAAKGKNYNFISTKTIGGKVGWLNTLFVFAKKKFDLDTNVFEDMAPKSNTFARDEFLPFNKVQLELIFSDFPTKVELTSFDWLMLISAYHGMRLMEITYLRKKDLQRTEAGIWYFNINNEEDKSTKTRNSIRKVPLHPILEKFGFRDVVKNRNDRLFEDVPIGPIDNRSKKASRIANRLIKETGAKVEKTGFHSFRHSFTDAARNSAVREEVRNAIMGHSQAGMGGRYGAGFDVEVLSESIKTVRHGISIERSLFGE